MNQNPARRPPSLEALRTLVEFADKTSIGATADKLGMLRSVVSRKLQVFETADACGAILLKRAKKGGRRKSKELELTEAARAVLPAIRELVRHYGDLLRYLQGLQQASQIVRLGVGSFAAEHYLPRLVAESEHHLRDWEIVAEIARGRDRILGTAEGRFDLAVVSHDPFQIQNMLGAHWPKTDLAIEALSEFPFCVLAKKSSAMGEEIKALSPQRALATEALARWPLVGLDSQSGIRRFITQHLASKGLQPQFLSQTGAGGWHAAKEYARRGLGVTLLPLAMLAVEDARDFVIRRLSDRLTLKDYLIHRRKDLSPAQKEAQDALRRAVEDCKREAGQRWKDVEQNTGA